MTGARGCQGVRGPGGKGPVLPALSGAPGIRGSGSLQRAPASEVQAIKRPRLSGARATEAGTAPVRPALSGSPGNGGGGRATCRAPFFVDPGCEGGLSGVPPWLVPTSRVVVNCNTAGPSGQQCYKEPWRDQRARRGPSRAQRARFGFGRGQKICCPPLLGVWGGMAGMASPWNRHCPGAPQTIEGASVRSGATQVRDPASQSLVGGLNYATMITPLASGIARISLRGSDGDFGPLCSSQGAFSAHQGPFSTQGGPCGRLQGSPCSSSGVPWSTPGAPCGRSRPHAVGSGSP